MSTSPDIISITNASQTLAITLPAFTVDGPLNSAEASALSQGTYLVNSGSPHTTLTFYGKGVGDYAQRIQQNFLYLLDNFANQVPPVLPLPGQLWFDSQNKILQIFYNGVWNNILDNTSNGVINGPLAILNQPAVLSSNDVVTKDYVDNAQFQALGSMSVSSNYNAFTNVLTIELSNGNTSTSYIQPSVTNVIPTLSFNNATSVLTLVVNGNTSSVNIPISAIANSLTISSSITNNSVVAIELSNGSHTSFTIDTAVDTYTFDYIYENINVTNTTNGSASVHVPITQKLQELGVQASISGSSVTVILYKDTPTNIISTTTVNMNDAMISRPVLNLLVQSTGQELFVTPPYTMGAKNLWVFEGGIKQYNNVDYTEVSSTSIQFNHPVPVGVHVEFNVIT